MLVRIKDETAFRVAEVGEMGEAVIVERFPYQALTVWNADEFGTDSWRGDLERWGRYFEPRVGYVQGDSATRHAAGAYTFHGRSDEVRASVASRLRAVFSEHRLRTLPSLVPPFVTRR